MARAVVEQTAEEVGTRLAFNVFVLSDVPACPTTLFH